MKHIYCLLLLFFFTGISSAQYWIQRGGGLTIDEGLDIAADGSNNTYTTGYFTTSATFDNSTTVFSVGLHDIFIAKTNATGALQWVKQAGGPNVDKALSIDADNAGNFIITGFYYATATFDAQSITSAGLQDAFVAKYDASGVLLWIRSIGGTGSDAGNSVTFDNAGNIIVTGEFSGVCSFGPVTLTSQGGSIDVFTAKYDNNGNLLWAKKGSGKYTDRGTDVSTDAGGNIYVSGMFSDTVTFDLVHDNPMYNAMFVIKYSSSGAEQWFRWMGSGTAVNMGGVKVFNNDVNITGNFNGTLYFFGFSGIPTLSSTFPNNIFICRFDLQGNFTWSHADGSVNEVTAQAISTNSTGEVIVGGNFRCRFSDYSAQYGTGIFCSVGYLDTYVASYDNSGNWMWARHFGGKQDDYLNGLAVKTNDQVIFTGSYEEGYPSTATPSFTAFGNTGDYPSLPLTAINYCADNNYGNFVKCISYGNSDIVINSNVDLTRQPYDFFERIGGICDRPFNDMCIGGSNQGSLSCPDTIFYCHLKNFGVDLNMLIDELRPDFNYLWSNGSTSSQISASTSGYYNVNVTSADGCFSNTDTVYYVSWPLPPIPTISDSKGINTNAIATIEIPLCLPDSVVLNCTNAGTNAITWQGFLPGQNPVTVSAGGNYLCTLTNQFGCERKNNVTVKTDSLLPAVQPMMLCEEDSDHNDTIELCLGESFKMYLYDQLTNPGGLNMLCFPGMDSAKWSAGVNVTYLTPTACSPNSKNNFTPTSVGSYHITVDAWIIRFNNCDSDSVFCSKSIFVIVHPVPAGIPLFVSMTGPNLLCFGDTVMLVASPDSLYFEWSTGEHNDTIYVTQPGTYTVSSTIIVVNSFGCTANSSGSASIQLSYYPQPVITTVPGNALICPNDSVLLICSGTGPVSWQGPNGNFGFGLNSVYVNTPGFYYCIQTVAPGCDVVSNTIQVTQYNVPLIIASPGMAICSGDPVLLIIITDPGSIIQWQAPLSGSDSIQLVTTPGTYYCTVTSCGIVTPLSYVIYGDSAVAIITGPGGLSFCSGDSVLLTANPGMASYSWIPGFANTTSIYVSQPGNYSLVTTSVYGCRDTASVTVTLDTNMLVPPLVQDTTICKGDSVVLNAQGGGNINWATLPDYNSVFFTGSSYQTHRLFSPITYYLFSEAGLCRSGFDSVRVSIDDHCHHPFIPNIVTPNGDGLNDYFPFYSGIISLDIKIYNRWGLSLYEGYRQLHGWDGHTNEGKLVSDGTYYYIMSVVFIDGYAEDYSGFVTVLTK